MPHREVEILIERLKKQCIATGQEKMAENIVIDAQKRAEMDHLTAELETRLLLKDASLSKLYRKQRLYKLSQQDVFLNFLAVKYLVSVFSQNQSLVSEKLIYIIGLG